MKTCFVKLVGRFGNQLFIYAHGRAWCDKNGYELITSPWIGERIFSIDPTRRLSPDQCDNVLSGYFQDQGSLIYTRQDVKKWFRFKPEIWSIISEYPHEHTLAHRRVGDYLGYGYPVVSKNSYIKACKQFGLVEPVWITEENPSKHPQLYGELSFIPDFARMMRCENLLRGNSTFSWWASTLGNARTFSPIIDGVTGGKESDCQFVEGNHPKFVEFDFVTDLHLPER